ncbi:MAG: lipopolysaccharide biosynthesis protein [Pirellulales bacterium]
MTDQELGVRDWGLGIGDNPKSNPGAPGQNLKFDHPAPPSGWRRLAADMAAVGGSTIVCQGIGVLTSLALRAALSPTQMGVWQGLKLLLGYANYANLGISKGAARELAVASGTRQLERAEHGLDLAFTVNTLTSVVYGLFLVVAALWFNPRGGTLENAWSLGLLAMSVFVVLQRHVTFHVTILRCRQAFGLTSWVSIVEGLLTLVLAGLGAWQWGLPGLYGGTLMTMVGTLVFLRWRGVRPFKCAWQWSENKRLVAIGGPILLGGVALTLFQSLDKLMLLSFSPERAFDLGCYSITLLITAQIYGLANMFAMVVAPRYAELFGRTGSRREVAHLAARASELLVGTTSAAAVLGLTVAVPVLAQLFPAYRPGLPTAMWLVPGIAVLALTLPSNQYLVAVSRERAALVASLAALVTAAAGDYLALLFGHGLMGVAVVTALAYGGYYLLMLALSLWPRLDWPARRRYFWTHAVLLAPIAVAVCLTGADFKELDLGRLALTSIIGLSAWTVAVMVVWRRGSWSHAWGADVGWDSFATFAARCQKPDYRVSGNWMARRISRPMALAVTWVIAPTTTSAHAVTCLAIVVALLAAACFAMGAAFACLVGAILLQVWYLLDHVDGQVARLRGTASLDGIQLDYLMHHVVNLVLPCSLGYGVWRTTGQELWLPLGFAFAAGLLLLGLANDTRYKAFIARLKQLEGIPLVVRPAGPTANKTEQEGQSLVVRDKETRRQGDKGNSISPCLLVPLSPCLPAFAGRCPPYNLRHFVHLARKLCEIHVVMNCVTLLAVVRYLVAMPRIMQCYLSVMAPLALLTAVATLTRDIRRGAAEREFARWYSTGIHDGVQPDEQAHQRAEPEVMSPGNLVIAGNDD